MGSIASAAACIWMRGSAKGGFCSPDDAMRAEALRLTREGIDLAAEVGAHFIIWPGIEGYNYPFQTPYGSRGRGSSTGSASRPSTRTTRA